MLFNPHDYIESLENGLVVCSNPVVDGGLSAITVNKLVSMERRRAFEDTVRRMVLSKSLSPKFAEVILAAMAADCETEEMSA